MILGAALTRLVPHVPNVTAVVAMALLGGAYLSNRSLALFVPIAALFLSDLVLGFHSTVLFVYGAVALIAALSFWSQSRGATSISRLAMSSISASLLFFFITNFGVWMMDHWYEKSAAGLMKCYVMALPFLGTEMIGDLFYTALLFGGVELVRRLKPALLNETF